MYKMDFLDNQNTCRDAIYRVSIFLLNEGRRKKEEGWNCDGVEPLKKAEDLVAQPYTNLPVKTPRSWFVSVLTPRKTSFLTT